MGVKASLLYWQLREQIEAKRMTMINPGPDARRLLRRRHYGVLATIAQQFPEYPYGSFVDYVTDHLGRPVILISALAEHTQNINRHALVSLAVHDPGLQSAGAPRLTLLGEAKLIGPDDAQHIRSRYLRYFPEAEQYLSLDFAFYRIEPQHIRYIAGFAEACWVNAIDFLALGSRIAEVEDELLQQIQGEHALLVGVDSDGCEMRHEGELQRIEFAEFAADAAAVRVQCQVLANKQ